MFGHFDDLTGKEIGIFKVVKFSRMAQNGKNGKHGMSYYVCECKKCGRRLTEARSHLIQGKCIKHRGSCI